VLVETNTKWHSLSNVAAPIALIVRLMHVVLAVLDRMSTCNTPPASNIAEQLKGVELFTADDGHIRLLQR
jgi:hypothetical protein